MNEYESVKESGQNQVEVMTDTTAIAALNKSEIDQQIATSRQFPRSVRGFISECQSLATLDENTAAQCYYAMPRGGKMIEGPSARFAEIVAHSWGNCRSGARILSEEKEYVVAQGVCHDLEKNVAISYEVRRRIVDRNGKRYNADVIQQTANAAASIALRNAILKVVPKAVWEPIYEKARATAAGSSQTLATSRKNAIAHLAKFGVSEQQIYDFLGVGGAEDITHDHLATLRGVATAIKEGDGSVESIFGNQTADTTGSKSRTAQVAEKIRGEQEPKPASNEEEKPEPAEKKSAGKKGSSKKKSNPEQAPLPTYTEAQQEVAGDMNGAFGIVNEEDADEELKKLGWDCRITDLSDSQCAEVREAIRLKADEQAAAEAEEGGE